MLSRQLREKPDHRPKAWAEKQVLETPFSVQITISWMSWFVNSRLRRTGNPAGCSVFCVVFHSEEGLKRMLGETRHYGIPTTLRGR